MLEKQLTYTFRYKAAVARIVLNKELRLLWGNSPNSNFMRLIHHLKKITMRMSKFFNVFTTTIFNQFVYRKLYCS